jgi:hypothetical protein
MPSPKAANADIRALKMFDPALVGVPIAVVGIGFHDSGGTLFSGRTKKDDKAADLAMRHYTAEFEVREGSRIVDRTLEDHGDCQRRQR